MDVHVGDVVGKQDCEFSFRVHGVNTDMKFNQAALLGGSGTASSKAGEEEAPNAEDWHKSIVEGASTTQFPHPSKTVRVNEVVWKGQKTAPAAKSQEKSENSDQAGKIENGNGNTNTTTKNSKSTKTTLPTDEKRRLHHMHSILRKPAVVVEIGYFRPGEILRVLGQTLPEVLHGIQNNSVLPIESMFLRLKTRILKATHCCFGSHVEAPTAKALADDLAARAVLSGPARANAQVLPNSNSNSNSEEFDGGAFVENRQAFLDEALFGKGKTDGETQNEDEENRLLLKSKLDFLAEESSGSPTTVLSDKDRAWERRELQRKRAAAWRESTRLRGITSQKTRVVVRHARAPRIFDGSRLHGTLNNSVLPLESMFLSKNMDSKGKTLLFRVPCGLFRRHDRGACAG